MAAPTKSLDFHSNARTCHRNRPGAMHHMHDRIAHSPDLIPDEQGGGTELTHVSCRLLCLVATTCPLCHRPAVPLAAPSLALIDSSSSLASQLRARTRRPCTAAGTSSFPALPRARRLPLLVFPGVASLHCAPLMVTWGDRVLLNITSTHCKQC